MEPVEELKKMYRTNVFIGAGVILSMVIYAVIVEVIRTKFKPFHGLIKVTNGQSLRLSFYGLAILMILVMRFLQPLLYRHPQTDGHKKLLMHLNTAALVTYFLAEVPAILGLVLFLLAGFSKDFYIFLFISLLLELMYFPRTSHWESWLRSKSSSP
jgi:F0F1-type ATP synthase membrane subunit c/vacuolar-type H+-ATPase subunit K